MKIKMKKTTTGSDDGIEVKIYHEGEIYEVSEDLAKVFLEGGLAIKVKEKEKIKENEED